MLEASAQTREQRELAERFGIDIDELPNSLEDKNNEIGEEDFIITTPEKEKKQDLRTYLGFRGDIERFGVELFSKNREIKVADDAQAPDDYLLGLGDQIIIQYYGVKAKLLLKLTETAHFIAS